MNTKKTKTIGIRTDDNFLKILVRCIQIYNASKSEIIRSTVARTHGIPVIQYDNVEFLSRPQL